ncbi:MAG: hypothetical protein ACLVEU_08100 [Bacteroides cellulosilyticus]
MKWPVSKPSILMALVQKELFDLLDHFKYIVPQGSPMTGNW